MLVGSRHTRDTRRGDVVLKPLFERLDEHGLAYCVLRGLDELGRTQDTYEVDLFVSPRDVARFRVLVARFAFEPVPAWGSAPHQFFVNRNYDLGAWFKLDVVTDLRYGPLRALRACPPAESLNRRPRSAAVRTLAPADEFAHLLLHGVLDKGTIEERHRARLHALRRKLQSAPGDDVPLVAQAAQFDSWSAPALTWADAVAACDRSDWAWIEARRAPLLRRLRHRQYVTGTWRAVRGWTARRLRPLQVMGNQRGLIVALLGPDGAGKTSVATALARSAPFAVRRIYMGYGKRDGEPGSLFQRGLWRLAGATPPPGGSRIGRRVQLGLRWSARIALQVGRSAAVRLRRAAGQVVVLDRHVYDLWLDDNRQQQYRSPARRALRWWITATSPAPDLVIVLDAPAEMLRTRKIEWPVEVLAQQRAAYLKLAEQLAPAVVVDASQDFAHVVNDVSDEIWHRRTSTHPDAPIPASTAGKEAVAKTQIRGSSLLLSGRAISLGLTLLAQVLIIRYLAPADVGRWMYALSVVTVLKSFAGLGIDRSITRFAAFYYERGDRARLLGVMALTIAAVMGAGAVMIGAVYAMPDQVMRLTQNQSEPLQLLLILIFLVPLEAMDSLLLGVFACFGNTRAIFFRKHIVAPGLRLAVVLAGVWSHASVVGLAYGYVIAAAVGILVYGRLLWRLCRDAGLFRPIIRVIVPVKEVFSFTLPMLVSDVAIAVMYGAGVLALGYFSDMQSVALFTVAVPLAVLNQTVMRSFSLLYTSAASKLFARGDAAGINELYWQTAVWLAILTFPIFALTFSAAGALVQFLFGAEYAAAGRILAVLALGEYVNVALGFNGLTLRVLNRSGYLTAISVSAAIVTTMIVFWAAPRYGAWGVAVATSGSMILHNVMKQLGLRLATGVTLFEMRYAGFYLVLAVCAAGLFAANWLLPAAPAVILGLACLASLLLLVLSKRVLKIADVFPEISRVPILRTLLA